MNVLDCTSTCQDNRTKDELQNAEIVTRQHNNSTTQTLTRE